MTQLAEQNDLSTLLEQFDIDGFTIGRQVFSPDEVTVIRDTFMDLAKDGPVEHLSEARYGTYNPSDPLAKYPRMMCPHLHPELSVGPLSRRYLLDQRLHAILQAMLRDEPVAVQSMFYFKPPGARGQDLHQDNFYLRVKPGTCLAAWVAIDDADEENGGMFCVPKTNALDIACPEEADPTKFFSRDHVEPPAGLKPQPTNLKAGDVLFFNGSVIHGSYPNTSQARFRRALIFHYVPRSSQELSQFYIQPLSFDDQVVNIPHAHGGGPCGTPNDYGAVH